jgi:hypothetical protein
LTVHICNGQSRADPKMTNGKEAKSKRNPKRCSRASFLQLIDKSNAQRMLSCMGNQTHYWCNTRTLFHGLQHRQSPHMQSTSTTGADQTNDTPSCIVRCLLCHPTSDSYKVVFLLLACMRHMHEVGHLEALRFCLSCCNAEVRPISRNYSTITNNTHQYKLAICTSCQFSRSNQHAMCMTKVHVVRPNTVKAG